MKSLMLIGGLILIAGCEPVPPQTPVQQAANQWAGANVALTQCAPYIGGFSDAQALKEERERDLERARSLGATDAMFSEATTLVTSQLNGAIILVGARDACSMFVSALGAA
ncbi:hypothetical protein [Falsiphaeobacter marinintestinus]|uniref:hypothetical protein n=1 Tax=Falsiphaeobacter marinintestinus TaxID=1492905 RepID=UPI0011B37066|nr:hypothetical protein [Phaeobacter marinintestinus]